MAVSFKRFAPIFVLLFAFALVIPATALAEEADEAGETAVIEGEDSAILEGDNLAAIEDDGDMAACTTTLVESVDEGNDLVTLDDGDDMEVQAETWLWPVPGWKGELSRGYTEGGHDGQDIKQYKGAPIVASKSGTVVYVLTPSTNDSNRGGYGNGVIIKHSDGYYTHYAHMDSTSVVKGQKVQRGQQIGTMGTTGNSTGVHLHFSIATNDVGAGGRINNNRSKISYEFADKPLVPDGKEMKTGYARTIPDGDYAIVLTSTLNAGTKCFLDIKGATSPAPNKANVELCTTKADPSTWASYDLWHVAYNSTDKFYTITQKGTSVALDVQAAKPSSGTNVQAYKSNGSKAQKWAISKNGGGYRIESACNGFSLDVNGGKLEKGTNVQVYVDNSSAAQRWSFVPIKKNDPTPTTTNYTVEFTDGFGNVIMSQVVDSGKPANPPADPTREGYRFVGWDKSFSSVTSHLTVNALWEKTGSDPDPDPDPDVTYYTVKFTDGFGKTLKTEKVAEGEFATPPDDPVHDGYEFLGWDGDYYEVYSDLTVEPMWWDEGEYDDPDATYYTVKFTDGFGKTLKTQKVEEFDDATPPATPKRAGYIFDGWDEDYTIVVEDLVVNATWKKDASKSVAWTRLAGDNAFKTMSKVIDAGSFAKGGTVVLASLEGYWDALTAAGIAGLEKAPVVMSTPDGLSAEAKAQLKSLAPKKIVVCGGTYWLPQKVLDAAKAAAGTSPSVVRLAGSNAAATAEAIAAQGAGSWSGTAIVATAGTFQDALAAAPVSWAKKMPIFLAQFDFAKGSGYISKSTINAMKDAGITKCYIAGGTYWIPEKVASDLKAAGITVVKRLGGATAVETSGLIAQEAVSALGMKAEKMGVANVAQHYDALASASFCGKNNSVLVLVRDAKSSVISGFVKSSKPNMTKGYVFGGTGSVSEASMNALKAATK